MTRLIDKDMLIEILGEMQGLCDTKAALIQNSKIWQQVKDLPVIVLPTVDAVPVRHGKWIDITESHIGTCSLCGDRWGSVDMMNYCPSCGARMDEE